MTFQLASSFAEKIELPAEEAEEARDQEEEEEEGG